MESEILLPARNLTEADIKSIAVAVMAEETERLLKLRWKAADSFVKAVGGRKFV